MNTVEPTTNDQLSQNGQLADTEYKLYTDEHDTRLIEDFQNLDFPVARFSWDDADVLTLRDMVRGVQIFGGIGSGKSSGSGQYLAKAFLRRHYGGIVLTGKPDEVEVWEEYARLTGRSDDLVIFSPDYEHTFNPLQYMDEKGGGFAKSENIVDFFTSIIKMGNRLSGGSGGSASDPFWDLALNRCMKSAIDLLKCAGENVTIDNIAQLIQSAPTGEDLFRPFEKAIQDMILRVEGDSEAFLYEKINDSYTYFCLVEASSRKARGELDESAQTALEVAKAYFLIDLPTLPEKTRGSILETFYSFANPFRSGLLAKYFATDVSYEVMPERTFEGKIIIINFSVKDYLQLGVYAQCIYKKIWQQIVENRKGDDLIRPVFMWVDEAQYFINEDDTMFQTTARSAKACTVLITQNISNYYAVVGGQNPKARVDSLLGNLSTKIFHTNNDYVTNEWAANTIGKVFQSKETINAGEEASVSVSDVLDYQVQPQEFTLLKTGGIGNVQAIITTAGKEWSNGKNYMKVAFQQSPSNERVILTKPWIVKVLEKSGLHRFIFKDDNL